METRTFTTTLKHNYHFYIDLPEEDAEYFLSAGEKRILVKVNDGLLVMHSQISKTKNGQYLIGIGRGKIKPTGLVAGDTIQVSLQKDDSKYQYEVPEEFQAVMDTDPEALELFDSLTPGRQRSLLVIAGGVKSTDKRIERALKIAENLKRGITDPKVILK